MVLVNPLIKQDLFNRRIYFNDNTTRKDMDTCRAHSLAKKLIANAPAADVAPVAHGRWLDTDTFDHHCVHIYQCSNCRKEVADDYIDNHKFCLHCGAKMEGDNK